MKPQLPRRWCLVWIVLPAVVAGLRTPAEAVGAETQPGIAVDAAFPGGNIVLEKLAGDTVFLHQDLRDTAGDWFYWCFRVRGAAGRTLTFKFTGTSVLGVRGPSVSTDEGKTWSGLGAAAVKSNSFRYTFPDRPEEVRFAFAIPYTESHLKEFLTRHREDRTLRVETLCRTAKGRPVELLLLGPPGTAPDARVLLTARHHACESLASYVLEGLLETVLADADDGAWLRRHVEFMAVPFMDKDGVEDGDQGKNRKPHDHNRDYVQKLYPSVRALTQRVPAWSAGKLRIALDLHCPWIRGPHNDVIYFVGSRDAENWRRTTDLATILQSACRGPIPYHVSDNLPFGQAWNTGAGDPKLAMCSDWTAGLPGVRVGASMEIPFATASGSEVTAHSARAFGRDLARAIRRYLER